MNEPTPTRMIRWQVTCQNGHRSTWYVLAGDPYGILLGSTSHGEQIVLDSWQDAVFEEVETIVKGWLKRDIGFSECFQDVLGDTCDQAPSGDRYDFSGRVYCQVCGLPANTYGPNDPPQTEMIAVAHATHEGWRQLVPAQRRAVIREGLVRVGCLATDVEVA